MNRRRFLAAFGSGPCVALAGCLNDPGVEGGVIEILRHEAPQNATVTDATDERIANVEPLQRGLREAYDGGSGVDVDVSEREFEAVAAALSALPWYDRRDHDTEHGVTHISGIYIRYEDEIFVVVLTPYCTDSVLIDVRSDRGEYGWGGCLRRDDGAEETRDRVVRYRRTDAPEPLTPSNLRPICSDFMDWSHR